MRKSFLLTAIRERNDLRVDFRSVQSPSALKIMLQHKPNPNTVYGEEFDRLAAIDLTRLRRGNGNFNANLFSKQLAVPWRQIHTSSRHVGSMLKKDWRLDVM